MFDQEVVRISSLETKVLVIPSKHGGEQHIYSDRSRSWEELLRLEWADTRERPIFLEEMSRSAIASVAAPITTETAVSESIQTVLGTTDPKTASLRLIRGDLQTLLSVAEVSIDDVAAIPAEMNEETVKAIVRATQRPVVFINPTANPPVTRAAAKNGSSGIDFEVGGKRYCSSYTLEEVTLISKHWCGRKTMRLQSRMSLLMTVKRDNNNLF